MVSAQALELNEILLLVMERLPATALRECLLVCRKWNSLVTQVVRKRLLDSTHNRQIPHIIGEERTELDILLTYERFVGFKSESYEVLQQVWSESLQEVPFPNFDPKTVHSRNINYVSEYQFDQEYYVRPTLLQNNQIVLFVEALDHDDCIAMFLVDPFQDSFQFLPWRLYNETILANSYYSKWYVCSNFNGNTVLYDPNSPLEEAVHQTRPGSSEILVRGNYMVTQCSKLLTDSEDTFHYEIVVYMLPEHSLHDEVREMWAIMSEEERYFDINGSFLASFEAKENAPSYVEIFNIEDGTSYRRIPIPVVSPEMFISSFYLTRFHLVFYQRDYFPAADFSLKHSACVIDLKSLASTPKLQIPVQDHPYTAMMAIDVMYDESGLVARTEDELQLMSAKFSGEKFIGKMTADLNSLGFWMCVSGKPMFWTLPVPPAEIFRPMVFVESKSQSHQTLKVLSYRDGCFQATHPLVVGSGTTDSAYYEITLVRDSRDNSALAVGLAEKDYPALMLPGWRPLSVGVHSDDGLFFMDDGEHGLPCSRPFKVGDVIGIGYRNRSIDARLIEFYITVNGETTGTFSYLKPENVNLYPTIGADGSFEIKVTFAESYEGCFESSTFLTGILP
jgi:hypothetical protein